MDNSSERGTPDRGDESDVGSYVDRKLLGSVFSGSYTDRCWIDALQSYRDRLQVDNHLSRQCQSYLFTCVILYSRFIIVLLTITTIGGLPRYTRIPSDNSFPNLRL